MSKHLHHEDMLVAVVHRVGSTQSQHVQTKWSYALFRPGQTCYHGMLSQYCILHMIFRLAATAQPEVQPKYPCDSLTGSYQQLCDPFAAYF